MSSISRAAVVLCTLAVLAACAKKEEPVVYAPEPVPAEPVYQGKL